MHRVKRWRSPKRVNGEILRWPIDPCYLNTEECNLNQTKDDSFVERVVKNNSWNNGVFLKVHEIVQINSLFFIQL